jgi:hypothetical protein
VCGLSGIPHARIWQIGNTICAGKNAIAAIEISVKKIEAAKLSCKSAPTDYPEHGVIIGWSDEKELRLAAQQELAANIARILKPAA